MLAEPLTEADRLCLRIAAQSRPYVGEAALPRVLGLSAEDVGGTVDQLVGAGLLERWPEKQAVVITPLAEERLDLVYLPDERGRHVWYTRGTHGARKAALRSRRSAEDVATADIPPEKRRRGRPAMFLETDLRDDDGASPFDEIPGATSCERAETTAPILLLGLGPAWPIPHEKGERCKGCRHCRKLPAIAYCCWCSRSGNRNLRSVPLAHQPKGAPAAEEPASGSKDDGLAGGVGSAPKGRKKTG